MKKDKQLSFLTQDNISELPKRKKISNLKMAGEELNCSDNSALFFDNLITIEELAKYIGVSSKTIQNWVALRSIPFLRVGRKTRFRKKQIKTWLQTKEFEPCL